MLTIMQRLKEEEGNSLVEMAISSLLFAVVLFGVFELCLASYSYHLISEVARDGSRWAIVRGSDCHTNTPGLDHCGADEAAISDYVKGLNFPGINSADRMTVTAAWFNPGATTPCSTQCNKPGNSVRVTVQYKFPLAVPFVPANLVQMSSASRMVISQ